jgi:hypothetical protein
MPENPLYPEEPIGPMEVGSTIGIDDGEHVVSDKNLTDEEAAAALSDLVDRVGGVKAMTGEEDTRAVFKMGSLIVLPPEERGPGDYFKPNAQSRAEREFAAEQADSDYAEALDMPLTAQYALGLIRQKVANVLAALDTLEGVLAADDAVKAEGVDALVD